MAFDPDAYLQKKQFDPNAYLNSKLGSAPIAPQQDPSITESLLRGAAQGATLGNADELTGLLESLTSDKSYEQARNESRSNYKAAEQANPIASTVGNIGGGLATMLIPGVGELGMGKGIMGAAKTGAAIGGLSAIGSSEQDMVHPTLSSVGNLGKEVLSSAELGGATGGIIGAAGKGLSALKNHYAGDKLGQEIIDTFNYAKANPEFNTSEFYPEQAIKTRNMAGELHGKIEGGSSEIVNAAYETAKADIPDVPLKDVMKDILDGLEGEPQSLKIKVLEHLQGIGDGKVMTADDLTTLKNSLKNTANTYGFTSEGNPNANPKLYAGLNKAADNISNSLNTEGIQAAKALRNKQGDVRALLDSEISGGNLDAQKLSEQNAIDDLKNSALKNQSNEASNEAIRYEKGTTAAAELQKAPEDYMSFLNNFNDNIRQEHLAKQARDTSYLATNTTNFLSTLGRSAKGKGMLAAGYAGDAARTFNNFTDRMINAPSNFLETLGNAMITAGKPVGNVILKASSQPDAKRKATMFALMQQPGIRELLQEHTPEEKK